MIKAVACWKDASNIVFKQLLSEAGVDWEGNDILVQSVFGGFSPKEAGKYAMHIFIDWEAYRYDANGAREADIALLNRSDKNNCFRNPIYYPLFVHTMTHAEKNEPPERWTPISVNETTPFANCIIMRTNQNKRNVFEAVEKVDSINYYGSLGNKAIVIPKGEKRAFMCNQCRARFNICPENTTAPGYVTEKPADAFLTGHIPVWRGDPGPCSEWITNDNTIIYENGPLCTAKLKGIKENTERYKEMVAAAPKPSDVRPALDRVLEAIHTVARLKGCAKQ